MLRYKRPIIEAAKSVAESALGSSLSFEAARLLDRSRPTRRCYIVNYHATYERDQANFEQQIRFLAAHFDIVPLVDLPDWLSREERSRPALSFTFDDGAYSNYAIAAPTLESFGFKGTFLIPTEFVNTDVDASNEQERAENFHMRYLDVKAELDLGAARVSMSWDEIVDLQRRGHTIGVHGRSHLRLGPTLTESEMHGEIVTSRAEMEQHLGEAPSVFCWIGGEEGSYSSQAADLIRRTGYEVGLMTCSQPVTRDTDPLQWHRFNIESDESIERIRFLLSGAYEVAYMRKRARVNRLTSAA